MVSPFLGVSLGKAGLFKKSSPAFFGARMVQILFPFLDKKSEKERRVMKAFEKLLLGLIMCVPAGLVVSSCDDDDVDEDCYEEVDTRAEDVTGPETAEPGEEIAFTVAFEIDNSCGQFKEFETTETESADTAYAADIKATVAYDGCICNPVITTAEADYRFTPSEPGVYLFRFWQDEGEWIERIVVVE